MDHHVAVAVLHTRNDLLEELPRLILHQPALLHNIVKELSGLCRDMESVKIWTCPYTI